MPDPYEENYTTLMKDMQEELNRLNVLKMSVFPNLIYRVDTILIKVPEFCEYSHIDGKVYAEKQRTLSSPLSAEEE